MSGFMDKIIERVRRETAFESALKMLKKGKLTLEEIAECVGLSLAEVKELSTKNSV